MMNSGPSPTLSALRTPQAKGLTVGGRADGGFLQYIQLLNPRNSMSITNTKGLLNMPGQNNCFLNSAVQVLWHLDIFRRSFRELCGHACMEDSCIFCALKELFAQFQYSQESALLPDALRRALAETFCDQRRFQLGFMDDAAECFENILMRIHFHIANNESEDMCSAVHCIPHQKFAMTLVEQTVCHACGATSEPLPFTQMVHYVPTSALCSQAKLMKEKNEPMPNFSELLKKAGGLGDLRDCPSSCGAVIQIRKTLMNRPEIVSVGLVWDSERPTIDHIIDVFKTIGMSLKLQDVFHSVVDSRWASTATHQLVGIVTYYGKHYSTFFFHTKLRVWIYFDDAAVREIGPKWEQVVEKCCKGHFQPLLLLYANPHGTPVNTSTAPRLVTVVPGHKKNINGKDSSTLSHDKLTRLSQNHTANNQRRSLTPNPEVSSDINPTLQPRRAVTPSGELTWWEENLPETDKNNSTPNTPIKDNSAKIHQKPYFFNNSSDHNPTQSISATLTDCNTSLKNRLMARLSMPNCSFHLANNQQAKNNTIDSVSAPQSGFKNTNGFNNSTPPDNNTVENNYISREAVENVLQLQKLQRQRSMNNKSDHPFVGQRNSSSSLESLDNVFSLRDKGLPSHLKFDIPDASNVARRRDSGNWSGDRNSASSSSTTSLDNPYFYVVGNKRYPAGIRNPGRPGETSSLTDAGYDSFSLSSSDSYPSMLNNSPGKLGQIPEHVQTAFIPYDISQLQYCLKDLKSNEHFPFGFKDECDKLCAEADIFVAKSIERENVGDISMAALLSDTAAARARAAMDVPYTTTQALAMAKMKHSMCLIRSSNLHKKLKEAETALRRKQKDFTSEPSRKEVLMSTNNKLTLDMSSNKSTTEANVKKQANTKNSEEQKSDKKIEIYATLPKRSLKKKGSSFSDSLTGDESSEEKSSKHKTFEETKKSPPKKSGSHSSLSDRDKSPKSPNNKKKSHKTQSKDSDLSDYSSEWEQTKKSALYRTYSGPTSNSKSELSDLSSSSAQTLGENTNKKQHRIRRKLMGGFMRRKNRSLPDLREGQDSGGETSRSFDDCFFSQTPTPSRKSRTPEKTVINNQNACSELTRQQNLCRTHTPPPYKPPPPITHASPKKGVETQVSCQPRVPHHPQLTRDTKNHGKLETHHASHSHLDFASGSAIWLKELQLKQEEMNRKKQQQEERERWIAECGTTLDGNSVGSRRKTDSVRETLNQNQQLQTVGKDSNSQSPQKCVPSSNGCSEADPTSVRDLTSKFERIYTPSTSFESISDKNISPSQPEIHFKSRQSFNTTQNLPEQSKLPSPVNNSHTIDKALHQSDTSEKCDVKERINYSPNISKLTYPTQATSGSVYNPHLTDAQLTNVLRIGVNRPSFRNSSASSENTDDSSSCHHRESFESRRPDKPPDYDTAIQRLELFRNERSFSKFYPSNCLNFEAILEQVKRRRGPKKSVTFSDKVVLVACGGDEDNDFIPNPLLERVYKQHMMQKPVFESQTGSGFQNTKEAPETSKTTDVSSSEAVKQQVPLLCNLCHKKAVETSKLYCPDCAYYMSRFQQKS